MTRRTLLIIIALLVIVDIAAAFWYLAAKIEASGESRDLWEIESDSIAELADTMVVVSVPDTFRLEESHAYYMSATPAVRGDRFSHYACIKQVKKRWPESVNGHADLSALERVLTLAMTGNASSLHVGLQSWLRQPQFTVGSVADVLRVDTLPRQQDLYTYRESILVYPVLTSSRLLVMEVDRIVSNAGDVSQVSTFIHYDRMRHAVLKRGDILSSVQENALLAMINAKITVDNEKRQQQWELSSHLPSAFYAQRDGIVFLFQAGDIAPVAEGDIQVKLSYKEVEGALTPKFRELLAENEGYWNYKPLRAD